MLPTGHRENTLALKTLKWPHLENSSGGGARRSASVANWDTTAKGIKIIRRWDDKTMRSSTPDSRRSLCTVCNLRHAYCGGLLVGYGCDGILRVVSLKFELQPSSSIFACSYCSRLRLAYFSVTLGAHLVCRHFQFLQAVHFVQWFRMRRIKS